MINLPKDDLRFKWTAHIKNKMLFYHISKLSVLRILKTPNRVEEGIAQNTHAAMKIQKSFGKDKKESELWLMYQVKKIPPQKHILISTWRYPGRTKPGAPISIPEDTLAEIDKMNKKG